VQRRRAEGHRVIDSGEPMLMSIPGYAEYASGHARLVPGVW
jgi:hypothetical protein